MLDLTDRYTLLASFAHEGFGAEVGVANGELSQKILELNSPRALWLIDCWEHQSEEVYGHDPSNVPQVAQDNMYQEVVRRFAPDPRVIVLREFSRRAAVRFHDVFFDWIYLDANHLLVGEDIQVWWPKVKVGGWLAGHDYCEVGDYIKVKPIVDEWAAREGLELFVTRGETSIWEKNYLSWAVRRP